MVEVETLVSGVHDERESMGPVTATGSAREAARIFGIARRRRACAVPSCQLLAVGLTRAWMGDLADASSVVAERQRAGGDWGLLRALRSIEATGRPGSPVVTSWSSHRLPSGPLTRRTRRRSCGL